MKIWGTVSKGNLPGHSIRLSYAWTLDADINLLHNLLKLYGKANHQQQKRKGRKLFIVPAEKGPNDHMDFRDSLAGGPRHKAIARCLKRRGILVCDPGKLTALIRFRSRHKRKCYVFDAEKWREWDEQADAKEERYWRRQHEKWLRYMGRTDS